MDNRERHVLPKNMLLCSICDRPADIYVKSLDGRVPKSLAVCLECDAKIHGVVVEQVASDQEQT